jgi:hypothetical protein
MFCLGWILLLSPIFLKGIARILEMTQVSQKQIFPAKEIPVARVLNLHMSLKLRCPSRKCHKSALSLLTGVATSAASSSVQILAHFLRPEDI